MSPTHSNQAEQAIAQAERRELEHLQPPLPDPAALLDEHEFVRIRKIARFWDKEREAHLLQRATDLTIGSHAYQDYLTFVLTGAPRQIEVFLAVSNAGIAKSLLRSAYPGIGIQERGIRNLGTRLKGRFAHAGMISGIPSPKQAQDGDGRSIQQDVDHLERVIRGMRNTTWVYVVQAYPRARDEVVAERQHLLAHITALASMSRQQIQRSTQDSQTRRTHHTATVSQSMTGEIVDRTAEHAVELLEHQVKRLETALALGRWQVAVYYGATQKPESRRLGALLSGILSGPESRPDPIRTHPCQPTRSAGDASQFHTYLTSDEVALFLPLPTEEAPGYAVSDFARFDVDVEKGVGQQVVIGEVLWEGNRSGIAYRIAVDQLARHGAVFGVTGSGKTTTLLGLLYQLWQDHGKPFLVIEPAKTEYRTLLGQSDRKGKATGPIPDLRVYTLGDETVAPFRLNPFEFETSNTTNQAPVLSHIDFLKAVFNAAFILYAPMPYVLETALHEIYEDKGWNLATGENVRLSDHDWPARHRYPIFPTLSDLYYKVAAVTARLGYEAKIEQDVIAGLKARLGSLRLGSKGLMLDTPRGIPIDDLLSQPAALELENIGNDDEKVFLMGLLLTRIYGYRRLQASEGRPARGLEHVLVVEEAHRLLQHVSTNVDTETANLRAQAVETFVNMLSEVRHYGQGVLVAEQIPSKLTPDVVKNTNLKLVQRLPARDDRDLLGATMNMDEPQIRQIATLCPGEAIAYAEGDDHPYLLKIDDFKKRKKLGQPTRRSLSSLASGYISLARYMAVPEFQSYGLRAIQFEQPDTVVYQTALRYLDRPDSERVWARIIARTVFARSSLPDALSGLRRQVAAAPGHLAAAQYNEALLMLIVLGVAKALGERGAENGWPYPLIDSMRQSLTTGLAELVRSGALPAAASDLDRFVRTYEGNTTRQWGPYPGCQSCRGVCSYRAEVGRLISPIDGGHIRSIVADPSFQRRRQDYVRLADLLQGIIKQWLGKDSSEIKDLAYCTALVALPAIGFDEYEQAGLGRELAAVLLD